MEGHADTRPASPRPDDSADAAVSALVERHGARLHVLALRFCGNAGEAEDLVQETFLRAYRGWADFQGRSDPATWLYTIAARACQRFHRKRSGEPDTLDSLDEDLPFGSTRGALVPSPDPGPLEEEMRREGTERIGRAIVALPIEFRMPLVLKEVVGFSVAEVAEVMGIGTGTVKTRLHRARLRLRASLEEVLPRRALPPTAYSERVCLDLLHAKQESMDRGVAFPGGDEVVCERCRAVFRTLDLAADLCRDLGRGELPADVKRRMTKKIGEETERR